MFLKYKTFEALKSAFKNTIPKDTTIDSAAAKVLLKIDPILNKVIELESL